MQNTERLDYTDYEVEYEGLYETAVVRKTKMRANVSTQRDKTRTTFAKQKSQQRKLQRNTYGVKGGK